MTKAKKLKYCSNITPSGECSEKKSLEYSSVCLECDWIICCWTCQEDVYNECTAKEKCTLVEENFK